MIVDLNKIKASLSQDQTNTSDDIVKKIKTSNDLINIGMDNNNSFLLNYYKDDEKVFSGMSCIDKFIE